MFFNNLDEHSKHELIKAVHEPYPHLDLKECEEIISNIWDILFQNEIYEAFQKMAIGFQKFADQLWICILNCPKIKIKSNLICYKKHNCIRKRIKYLPYMIRNYE